MLLSLLHTFFTLTIVPLIHCLTTTHPFDPSHYASITDGWQSIALLVSMAYYVYDSLDMLQHEPAPLQPPSVYYLLHHVICIGGLLSPVLSTVDGSLVLVGLMLGELANPPRLWAQMVAWQIVQLQRQQQQPPQSTAIVRVSSLTVPPSSQLQQRVQLSLWLWHATLSSVHFVMFSATRLLGVWYFVSVLWPYSTSGWTVVWGGAMCVFSVCTVLVYVLSTDGVSIATTTVERRTDTNSKRTDSKPMAGLS